MDTYREEIRTRLERAVGSFKNSLIERLMDNRAVLLKGGSITTEDLGEERFQRKRYSEILGMYCEELVREEGKEYLTDKLKSLKNKRELGRITEETLGKFDDEAMIKSRVGRLLRGVDIRAIEQSLIRTGYYGGEWQIRKLRADYHRARRRFMEDECLDNFDDVFLSYSKMISYLVFRGMIADDELRMMIKEKEGLNGPEAEVLQAFLERDEDE